MGSNDERREDGVIRLPDMNGPDVPPVDLFALDPTTDEQAFSTRVARITEAAGRERVRLRRRGAARGAIALSIFSVAITAAASWSESTPRVEKVPSACSSERQVMRVSTSAVVRPPGGMRTRKSASRGTSSSNFRAAFLSAFMKAS